MTLIKDWRLMMKTQKQQRGITFIGLLLVLAVIGFFSMVTIKVVPIYMEYGSIAHALDQLPHYPDIGKQGKGAIIKKINSQLYIDDVRTIDAKTFDYKKEKDSWVVTADYEGRRVLFGDNIGVFVKFKKTVKVPR